MNRLLHSCIGCDAAIGFDRYFCVACEALVASARRGLAADERCCQCPSDSTLVVGQELICISPHPVLPAGVCATAGVAPQLPSQAQAVALSFNDEVAALEAQEFRGPSNSGGGLGNHEPGSILSGDRDAVTARSGRARDRANCPAVAGILSCVLRNATTFAAAADSRIQAPSPSTSASSVTGA
jgi:hypothetical protein